MVSDAFTQMQELTEQVVSIWASTKRNAMWSFKAQHLDATYLTQTQGCPVTAS